MKKQKSNFKRVGLNLPTSLYDKLMKECEVKGLNLTSLIITYLDNQINQRDILDTLTEYLPLIKEIRDTQNLEKNEE